MSTPISRDSPQSTITEEVSTPLAEEVSLGHDVQAYGDDKATLEVMQATKRILETVRLRDFQAYQYVK